MYCPEIREEIVKRNSPTQKIFNLLWIFGSVMQIFIAMFNSDLGEFCKFKMGRGLLWNSRKVNLYFLTVYTQNLKPFKGQGLMLLVHPVPRTTPLIHHRAPSGAVEIPPKSKKCLISAVIRNSSLFWKDRKNQKGREMVLFWNVLHTSMIAHAP